MADDPQWKTELLASGLPLQSEAARLLVSRGFRVDSDFRYAPSDSGARDSLSVDLRAKALAPFADPERAVGALDLLLKCRHAPPGVSWLFLPDPNPPGDAAAAAGHTLRVVDEFSLSRIPAGSTAALDAHLPVCCKGLEIDPAAARMDDAPLNRGLGQLQCTLPRLVAESVLQHFGDRSGRKLPFLFCPVLLTTAPLLVAHRDLGPERVQRVSGLRELADEVPCLAIISDYGPDFPSLCQRQFRMLEGLERDDDLLMVETKRAALCHDPHELPVAMLESLATADPYRLRSLFTRFIVCTHTRLPELIDKIQQAAESALQSRQELH